MLSPTEFSKADHRRILTPFLICLLSFLNGGCGSKEATDVEDAYKLVPYLEKLSQIQEKENMPETEVDRIMTGFPSSVEEIKGDHAVSASMFKGKTAFVKIYDCKLPNSKRHFLIHVYFDDQHRVVGTTSSMKE
jgi:hypothetical protein